MYSYIPDTIPAALAVLDLARQLIDDAARYTGNATRSAWNHGVKEFADDLLFFRREAIADGYNPPEIYTQFRPREIRKAMLNGAGSWRQFSYGGSYLCANYDIARALCSPSQLRKSLNGAYNPNRSETWLDVQARALAQAADLAVYALHLAVNTIEFKEES